VRASGLRRFAFATVVAATVWALIEWSTEPFLSFDVVSVDHGDWRASAMLYAAIMLALALALATLFALPCALLAARLTSPRPARVLSASAAALLSHLAFLAIQTFPVAADEHAILFAGNWLALLVWNMVWLRPGRTARDRG